MKAIGGGSMETKEGRKTHHKELVVGECDGFYGKWQLLVYFVDGKKFNLVDQHFFFDGQVVRRPSEVIRQKEAGTFTVYPISPEIEIPDKLIWNAIEDLKPC